MTTLASRARNPVPAGFSSILEGGRSGIWERKRIEKIGVPPAYTDVWISPKANGHIQATGRDAKGRKQYRYHPDWTAARDSAKYERMSEFGAILPGLRKRVVRDMRKPGLPREKVLATIVSLLEKTLIRVGNEDYVKDNKKRSCSAS